LWLFRRELLESWEDEGDFKEGIACKLGEFKTFYLLFNSNEKKEAYSS